MFQITNIPTRYFEMEAPDTHRVLHIEPPKLKTLNKLNNWSKSKNPTVFESARIISQIISKNRENRKVSPETVMEWMDSDQLAAFLGAYISWLNKTKQDDPN